MRANRGFMCSVTCLIAPLAEVFDPRRSRSGGAPRRGPSAAASAARPAGAEVQRHQSRRRVVAPAPHPHDEHLARAERGVARRDHRRHEGRHLHGDQPVVVDRRQADQLPVRLRDRMAGQGRQADPDLQEPQLHGDHAGVLGIVRRRGRSRGDGPCGARRTAGRASPVRSAAWVTARRPRASATSRWACADAGPDRRRPVPGRRGGGARARRGRRRGGALHARMGRAHAVRELRDPPIDVPRGHRAARTGRSPQPDGRGVVQRLQRAGRPGGGREREGDGRGRGAGSALPRPRAEGRGPAGRPVLRRHRRFLTDVPSRCRGSADRHVPDRVRGRGGVRDGGRGARRRQFRRAVLLVAGDPSRH